MRQRAQKPSEVVKTPAKRGRKKKIVSDVTIITDPQVLPDYDPEIQVVSVDTSNSVELAPVLAPSEPLEEIDMLDAEDPIVKEIRILLAMEPISQEEQQYQAHQLHQYGVELHRNRRRIDMLVAEIAIKVHDQEIWRHLESQGIESEAAFWSGCGFALDQINQLIAVRKHAVPLLHALGIEDTKLEDLHPAAMRAVVSMGKKFRSQQQAATPTASLRLTFHGDVSEEGGDDDDDHVVNADTVETPRTSTASAPLHAEMKEQVEQLLALKPEDIAAQQRMEKGLRDKQQLVMKLTPHENAKGERFYTFQGIITQDMADAIAENAFYNAYDLNGELINRTSLGEKLRRFERLEASNVHHFQQPQRIEPDEAEMFDINDDDMDDEYDFFSRSA